MPSLSTCHPLHHLSAGPGQLSYTSSFVRYGTPHTSAHYARAPNGSNGRLMAGWIKHGCTYCELGVSSSCPTAMLRTLRLPESRLTGQRPAISGRRLVRSCEKRGANGVMRGAQRTWNQEARQPEGGELPSIGMELAACQAGKATACPGFHGVKRRHPCLEFLPLSPCPDTEGDRSRTAWTETPRAGQYNLRCETWPAFSECPSTAVGAPDTTPELRIFQTLF